jgi:hypothetical protein
MQKIVITNMDLINQMLTKQFYENGFEVFDRKKYISYINVSEIEWEYEGGLNNDYHPKNNKEFIDKCLLTIHYEIQNDIVPQSIMRKRRIWEGVNQDALNWHNDYREGPNCFFLLYFSDMDESKGGAVYFRNKVREWKIYPQKGLLVAVNCLNNFQHKAEKSNCKRIVSSFYFDL